jgi:CheY-like chemotaxis protein
VVRECIQLARANAPAGAVIEADGIDDELVAVASVSQLQQVVTNLLSNALLALGERGGKVHVGLHLRRAPVAPEAPASNCAGRQAILSVSDTGMGMSPETLRHIFEPFFTTRQAGSGTGLGLAIVDGIVRSLGGTIRVTSSPGKGSTFEVCLPASDTEAEAAPGQARDSRSQRSLLHVDAEPLFAELLARHLAADGWQVSTEASPAAALQRLRASPDAFDLVLTDYRMAGMSGLELAAAVREIDPDIPVALASGEISDKLRAEARHVGAVAVISKSGALHAVITAIERVLATFARRRGAESVDRS